MALRLSARTRTIVSSLLGGRKPETTAIADRSVVTPASPGSYVMMAYPPPGGTLVVPDGSGTHRRLNVRLCWIADGSDLWQRTDEGLAGEHECALAIERPDGTTIRTRDVVEWVVELKAACPAAYTSLRLAMADEALDQTGPEILN